MIKILGISGSLRKASYNSMLLQACLELLPMDAEFQVAPMDGLPLFSEDHVSFPAPVEALRQAAGSADGFLIATPEYNHSIPGGLKNALDWLSRPPKPPCSGKPLAIVGATTGAVGTARAQDHLRLVAVHLDLRVVNRPEVLLSFASSKFDAQGKLIDADARAYITKLLAALIEAVRERPVVPPGS